MTLNSNAFTYARERWRTRARIRMHARMLVHVPARSYARTFVYIRIRMRARAQTYACICNRTCVSTSQFIAYSYGIETYAQQDIDPEQTESNAYAWTWQLITLIKPKKRDCNWKRRPRIAIQPPYITIASSWPRMCAVIHVQQSF